MKFNRKIRAVVAAILAVLVMCLNDVDVTATENTTTVNIIMVGDDLIHSPLYKAALTENGSYDFSNQFNKIPEIKNADIAIINQETILVNDYSKISSYPCFGTPSEIADDIADAGFDIVASATNHSYDKGYDGIEDTISYWAINHPNIPILGIHDDIDDKDWYIRDYNGYRIGFVNYTYGLNGITRTKDYSVDLLSDDNIEDTMFLCCTDSDIQIAILHVGEEYRYTPTDYQKNQVEKFIDMGADIVICAHPHVVEPFEMIKTANGNIGLVYYSLGNFVSGQTEIDRCLGGMASFNVKFTTVNGQIAWRITDYDMIPLFTHQEAGNYTTYKLSDYSDELLRKHKLYGKKNGSNVDEIKQLYQMIVNNQKG